MEIQNILIYAFALVGLLASIIMLCFMVTAILEVRQDWLNEKENNERKEKEKIEELEFEIRCLSKLVNKIESKCVNEEDLYWLNKDVEDLKKELSEIRYGHLRCEWPRTNE